MALMSWICDSFSRSLDNGYKKVYLGLYDFSQSCAKLEDTLCGFGGYVGYQIGSGFGRTVKKIGHAASSGLKEAASKIADFITKNRARLLAYLVGWAVIVVCAGFINGYSPTGGLSSVTSGFKAVSLPMAIGLGVGGVFGAIISIALFGSGAIDIKKRPIEKSSVWGYINSWNNEIKDFGTHAILIAVAVSVVLALAYRYPYAVAGFGGALATQHGFAKLFYGLPLGPDSEKVKEKERSEETTTKQPLELSADEIKRLKELLAKQKPDSDSNVQ